MVTLLITAVALLVVLGIGLYFWQKPAPDSSVYILPPAPNARGLFAYEFSNEIDDQEQLALMARRQEELISEAKTGKRSALLDAGKLGDTALYERVLSALVGYSDSDPKLLSLMSYVDQHELPVSDDLAKAVISSWRRTPDRHGTAKALHFAALTDNPDTYRSAVESALQLWQAAELKDISAVELRALFDGEFWVLSSRSRSSGAGFVLKQTLESARRELNASVSANQ
jgi:hypothetical protein